MRDKSRKSTASRLKLRETQQLEAAEGEQQKGEEFSTAEESAAEENTKTKPFSGTQKSEEARERL